MAGELRRYRVYLRSLNLYRPTLVRRPQAADMRHLALMDFLLEHYEVIPGELLNLLCFCDSLEGWRRDMHTPSWRDRNQ